MKRALICLDQLGIGEVKNFTITQVEEFVRRKIKCYVLARDGLLSEKLKEFKNIEFVEFDFKLENRINTEKVEWLKEFIKEKKIDLIYEQQFSSVPYILPVVFETKIPYITYLNNIVPKTCEWFMDYYNIYKILFPIYSECVSKIIAITDKAQQKYINFFHLSKEKYREKSIVFLGAVSDMTPEIEKSDILLSVDRCLLEAVASKKTTIVCGYKRNIILITPNNIKDAIKDNFTGINLKDDKDELFKYSETELIKLINKNYGYVSKHLTITDSVYLDIEKFTEDSNILSVFKGLNYYIDKIKNLDEENKQLFLRTQG